MIVPWNDREAVERALGAHEVAAVLAEPYPANMGLVLPEPGFLAFLREATDANGALLLFDEVITGFRVARGGAQEREGVTPDLTVLGKVIGGGLPAAAYTGPAELMERVAPAGDVYQAGTLSGNPLATAAGLATLGLLDTPAYEQLEALAHVACRRTESRRRERWGSAARDLDHRPAHTVLRGRPDPRLRGRQGLRHRGARRLLPRHAQARDLPAAVAVRGVVSLLGAHGRARCPNGRGGARSVRGGGGMSALARVVEAADPALTEHAVASPGPDRFAELVSDPDRLFVLEAVYEGYLLHYGSPRAFAGMDRDLRLLGGDSLYALGLRRLAEIGDLDAVAELSDLISAAARAQAEGNPQRAEHLWLDSARKLGPGRPHDER